MFLAFFTFKNFSKCHRKVIPACRQLRICKIKFSEKVYIFIALHFFEVYDKKIAPSARTFSLVITFAELDHCSYTFVLERPGR